MTRALLTAAVLLAAACASGEDAPDARRIPPPVSDASASDPEGEPDAAPALDGHLVLNEVDYDQVGTDTDEFLEIINPTAAAADLSRYAVILVNGNDGLEYGRIPLSGSLPAGGLAVVASASVPVASGALVFRFAAASNNLQNGAPDAVALFDMSAGGLVDALSYQGSVAAGTVTDLGAFDFVEGTPTPASDDDLGPRSLVRLPDGADTDDAAHDWRVSSAPTPGAANVP